MVRFIFGCGVALLWVEYGFAHFKPDAAIAFSFIGQSIDSIPNRKTDDASPDSLEKIIVSSDRHQKLLCIGQSISIITSKEWEGEGKNLADIIQENSGIQTRKYGGLGSFQTLSIRGITGSKILVYLDDVPLNSGSGETVDLGKIDVHQIESIEIYKGIIPARFGGNGIGGVIHLVTKRNSGKTAISASSTQGSHDRQDYALSVKATPTGRLSFFSQISYESCKNDFTYIDRNFTPYNSYDDIVRTRVNSGYQDFIARASMEYRDAHDRAMEVQLSHGTNSGGIPGNENEITKTAGYENTEDRAHVSCEMRHWERAGWMAKAGLDYSKIATRTHWTKDDSLGYVLSDSYADFGSKNRKLMPYFQLSYCSKSLLSMEMNALGNVENLDPMSYEGNEIVLPWHNRRQTLSVALDAHFTADGLGVLAGAQEEVFHDATSGGIDPFSPLNIVAPSHSLDHYPSGKLGLSFQCNSFFLYANSGKYYRYPGLNEKFGSANGVLPNPDLKPENGLTFDAGLKYAMKNNYIDLCVFYTENTSAIIYEHSGNLLKPFNIDATQTKGVECNATAYIINLLSSELHATYQRATNASNSIYKNRRLPNEPDFTLVIKPVFGPVYNFSALYTIDFRSHLFRDAANLQNIPDQLLQHFMLQWRYDDNVVCRFTIQNITNTYYEDAYSWFPYPGRQYFLSLALSL